MIKASIFYFSGTGNTWWASERFAERLNKAGISAAAYSIEDEENPVDDLISRSDIIFLNYPVYGSDRPEIVKDFIKELPDTAGKDLGIVCTQLAFSGDGAWMEHWLFEAKGYRIRWTMHLKMPNNISIPWFPFSYTNDRQKLGKKLAKAEKRIAELANSVSKGVEWKQGRSRLSNLLGLMQRKPYRSMLPGLRDDQSIDPEACTKCGKCIGFCPADNIRFASEENGGFPEFQGKCILCLRCYNFCPGQAVMYRNTKFRPGRGERALPYLGPVEAFTPAVVRPQK